MIHSYRTSLSWSHRFAYAPAIELNSLLTQYGVAALNDEEWGPLAA